MEMKEAKKLLKSVKTYADELTLSGIAKKMGISVATLNARLVKASSLLEVPLPAFASGRGKSATKSEHVTHVQASGRGGNSKKIVIPQQFFDELGWEVKDAVKLRVYGKKKIIIEPSTEEEE